MQINKKNTIIILDWDDTLFPTSWVIKNTINLINPLSVSRNATYFNTLDNSLYMLLNKLLSLGKVYIISNAILKWINISSIILPKTNKILKQIKIISARQNYNYLTNDMNKWKEYAFKYIILSEYKRHNYLNIISVGDAKFEYNALVSLYKWNTKIMKSLKTIQFIKNPHQNILIEQINILYNEINKIIYKNEHIDKTFIIVE